MDEKLVAPLDVGEVLGEAKIYVDGEYYGSVELVNSVQIELSRSEYLKQKLGDILDKGWIKTLLILVVLFGGIYLALVLRYRSLRRRYMRERRLAEQRRRMEREKLYQEDDFYRSYDEANSFVEVTDEDEDDYQY